MSEAGSLEHGRALARDYSRARARGRRRGSVPSPANDDRRFLREMLQLRDRAAEVSERRTARSRTRTPRPRRFPSSSGSRPSSSRGWPRRRAYLRRIQGAAAPACAGHGGRADGEAMLTARDAGRPATLALEVENRQRVHCMVTPMLARSSAPTGVTWFPAVGRHPAVAARGARAGRALSLAVDGAGGAAGRHLSRGARRSWASARRRRRSRGARQPRRSARRHPRPARVEPHRRRRPRPAARRRRCSPRSRRGSARSTSSPAPGRSARWWPASPRSGARWRRPRRARGSGALEPGRAGANGDALWTTLRIDDVGVGDARRPGARPAPQRPRAAARRRSRRDARLLPIPRRDGRHAGTRTSARVEFLDFVVGLWGSTGEIVRAVEALAGRRSAARRSCGRGTPASPRTAAAVMTPVDALRPPSRARSPDAAATRTGCT